MLTITIIAGRESFFHDICFFYRASLGGPDERREQKFATLVGDHFGMSPTNILLTPSAKFARNRSRAYRPRLRYEGG
ncbi:hypothetical protein CWI35_03435 [[Bacillus] caldolyticus]|uniref:Uncharacterized protein n=1 Tax=Bacillus caldolyticus TaxID=1394 RepID=A0ABM6QJU9_BACCL|nr:hypothetical protein CWI35_03435 [[Bacillus] caldolyticus]